VAYHFAVRFHQREPVFDELPGASEGNSPVDTAPDPEHALMDGQRRSALVEAIRGLSPQQRHCLHLRVQGLRYREIAEAIGISTSAVGEFLRRAVARLQGVRDV
jgi:RNA polymerase sigma-70 factor (ECF subfamily)